MKSPEYVKLLGISLTYHFGSLASLRVYPAPVSHHVTPWAQGASDVFESLPNMALTRGQNGKNDHTNGKVSNPAWKWSVGRDLGGWSSKQV